VWFSFHINYLRSRTKVRKSKRPKRKKREPRKKECRQPQINQSLINLSKCWQDTDPPYHRSQPKIFLGGVRGGFRDARDEMATRLSATSSFWPAKTDTGNPFGERRKTNKAIFHFPKNAGQSAPSLSRPTISISLSFGVMATAAPSQKYAGEKLPGNMC